MLIIVIEYEIKIILNAYTIYVPINDFWELFWINEPFFITNFHVITILRYVMELACFIWKLIKVN